MAGLQTVGSAGLCTAKSPGGPAECGVFREADKLIICPGRRYRPEGEWNMGGEGFWVVGP